MIFWSTPPPGGALYDATKVPCVRVVQAKVSRSLATIQHAILRSRRGDLSRVALAVTTGLLQSLVDAIPQRIRQTYLRELHNELHELDMWGKDMCCTDVVLSAKALADLEWWLAFFTNQLWESESDGHIRFVVSHFRERKRTRNWRHAGSSEPHGRFTPGDRTLDGSLGASRACLRFELEESPHPAVDSCVVVQRLHPRPGAGSDFVFLPTIL
jgi:hypothetical protein